MHLRFVAHIWHAWTHLGVTLPQSGFWLVAHIVYSQSATCAWPHSPETLTSCQPSSAASTPRFPPSASRASKAAISRSFFSTLRACFSSSAVKACIQRFCGSVHCFQCFLGGDDAHVEAVLTDWPLLASEAASLFESSDARALALFGARIILKHRIRIILKHRRIRIILKHKRPG